jgi:undecaprenyl pyrophosphate phosphatase UppP
MQTMSNHKRLSQLSFTAVALLAAAIPCLAQTESRQARHSQTGAMSLAQTTEIAAITNTPLSAHKAAPKVASEAKVNESRDKFNVSIAQATSVTPGFSKSGTLSESEWQKTRRLTNDDSSSSAKRITFVPSRGQKLPE